MSRYGDRDEMLARILAFWLERPDEQRTEVKMLGFAFEAAANPEFQFAAPSERYPVIRDYLSKHGRLTCGRG